MTKGEIEHIIRRFPFIKKAINKELPRAVFYVGKWKQIINITPDVRSVYNIIDIIYKKEQNNCIKDIIIQQTSKTPEKPSKSGVFGGFFYFVLLTSY